MKLKQHYIVKVLEDNEWSTSSWHKKFIYAKAHCQLKLKDGISSHVIYLGKIVYPK